MNYPRLFPVALRSLALRSRAARLRVAKPVLAALPVLGAIPLLVAPAVAAPAKLNGVQAWTNASQTYIRVRPDQSTPIVAKVATHTPLYVWGKYNGWYRVQTQDDIFGWVHHELLNSSGLGEVKELSPAAVERAAKRSADTTMWGTPQQLKSYYAKHGAKGAAKGLIEMGVPVSIGSKPKVVKAKATPRKVAPRKVVSRPATRKVVSRPTTRKVATHPAPKPRVVTSSLATRVPVKRTPVVTQVAPAPSARTFTTLPVQLPVQVLLPATPKATTRKASAPAKAPAKAPVKAPTKRLTARDKRRQQLRTKMGMKEKTAPLSIGQIAPVSPEDLMKARRAYLEARKERLKDAPSANAETDNNDLGGPQLTPSSYERADNTLDRQGWAPFNTGGWNGSTVAGFGTADWSAQSASGFRLVVEEAEAATLGDKGIDDAELLRWNSLPTLDALQTQIIASAQKKAPSRGGSPRDRYRNAKGDFRKDIANKALSYRGRPYVFGSASPSRGFDCSGLIYYVLRQRGYNPPRVASGYRTYGTAVARKDLKVGDLLLFANTYKRGISHIGIYIGNNNFVHAASTSQGVRTDSLSTKYFASKYHSARRVPQR